MKKILSTLLLTLFVGSVFAAPFRIYHTTVTTSCGTVEDMQVDTTWTAEELGEYAQAIDKMVCG